MGQVSSFFQWENLECLVFFIISPGFLMHNSPGVTQMKLVNINNNNKNDVPPRNWAINEAFNLCRNVSSFSRVDSEHVLNLYY